MIRKFLRSLSIVSLSLTAAAALTIPGFAQGKKLNSVALTVGDLGNPFFVQIEHGVTNQAKQYNPNVKVTSLSSNYDVNNQTNQMDNFISSRVNLIILGAADSKGIAPAVIRANAAGITAKRKDFFIVGVDGSPDAVPLLKDPNSLFAATASQDPYTMAQRAVEIGYNIMQGKKPEKELILIPMQLITKENVNQYKGWTK